MLSWLLRKKNNLQSRELYRFYDKDDSKISFTISQDIDPQFSDEYYFAIEKNKKIQNDIVININKNQDQLKGLFTFLKEKVKKDEVKFYYLSCDCYSDLYRFVKDDDTLYIEYWTFGGQGNKKDRIDMATQYIDIVAESIDDLCSKEN